MRKAKMNHAHDAHDADNLEPIAPGPSQGQSSLGLAIVGMVGGQCLGPIGGALGEEGVE